MREIKFKAFIKKLGWVVPVEQIDFLYKTAILDLRFGDGSTTEFDFDKIELMQFTGLKDKNGVEIYEGDIIHIEISSDDSSGKIITSGNTFVEFKNEGFGFKWGISPYFTSFDGFHNTTFEVIGNIYENPELLEGEKQ